MLGLANLLTGGSSGQIDAKIPLGEMAQLGSMPEAANIQNLAKLPAFGQWNQSTTLKAVQMASTAKTRVQLGKQMADARKAQIDSAVEATGIRLNVKAHGMNSVAKIAGKYADFREKTLMASHGIETAKVRVSGMEQAMNHSNGLIAL